MPKRYEPYRYNYERIYKNTIRDTTIDDIIEKGLRLKRQLTYIVGVAMPEVNLFTESQVEDIVNHIIDVYVSYHYYELGRFVVVKDIN